jgi:hypothetical protein
MTPCACEAADVQGVTPAELQQGPHAHQLSSLARSCRCVRAMLLLLLPLPLLLV